MGDSCWEKRATVRYRRQQHPEKARRGDGVGVREGSGEEKPISGPWRCSINTTDKKACQKRAQGKQEKKEKHWKGGFPNFQISRVEERERKKKKRKRSNVTQRERVEVRRVWDSVGNMNPLQIDEIPGKVPDDFQGGSRG
ncbi:hypothetical protein CDAR_612351 [Caerostris darwini]|uniref:Uncharacterized protein n=1 Tax=Caerostris darwini TaxID=1538125 RepID=A0AAV4SGB5_9ARAC|nr:hypothetical protein CDAR_612351 [Caerostris darwini]